MENYLLAVARLKKKEEGHADFRNGSVLESNRHMLEKAVNCDTLFILGGNFGEPRELGAHRYILVSRSPVFARIFARGKSGILVGDEIFGEELEPIGEVRTPTGGGLAGKEYQHTSFVLPEVQPEAFMELLRYMYYEEASLTDTTVISMYYAASKFKVSALQELCGVYIRKNITVDVDNVCSMLDMSTIYKCHHFSKQCLDLIDSNPNVSQRDDFKNLTKPVLYGAMLYLDEDGLKDQLEAENGTNQEVSH